MKQPNTSRRSFLKMISAAGGGLVVGVPLSGCAATGELPSHQAGEYQHDAFIQISPDNTIHFYMPRSEMGQGTYHGLTTLIAEELNTQPELISVHHAPGDTAYNNPEYAVQATGGSTSMKAHFLPLRQTAANARAAILNAASKQLGVELSQLSVKDAHVVTASGEHPFGDFVGTAQQQSIPSDTPLKPRSEFRFIGKDRPRIDAKLKSTGTAEFGIDVDFPGLKRAAIQICPVHGGKVKSFDATEATSMSGVITAVDIGVGVAVVADHYWQAKQAVAKLNIEWDLPELAKVSSEGVKRSLQQAVAKEEGKEAHQSGEGAKALSNAARTFEAEYWAPYIAHATMEPMNCTVKLENGRCDVWVGCQAPGAAQGAVALITNLDRDKVTVHSKFLGGGFGRRSNLDYIEQTAMIAKATGLPVQLVWSREDDMRNDYYRPASLATYQAGVNAEGKLETLSVKRAGPNMMPYTMEEFLPTVAPEFLAGNLASWAGKKTHGVFKDWAVDPSSVEGLFEDYDIANKEARHVTVDPGLTTGAWRSVGHSFSGFFKESFIDEIAQGTNQDPVEFRLQHSQHDTRFNNTLKLAAEKAGWGKAKFPGASQGVAVHSSFHSVSAQVAEVSVVNGEIKIHRIVCAIDCGTVVNPDIVKAQMESCINFGLTAALHSQIDLLNGEVQQSNFHDYPMLRMSEAPEIEVHIVESSAAPTGVGEPGLPPVAPAVANAIFAATGKRLRSLPLKLS